MMKFKIVYECHTCRDFARQYMGSPGFVMPQIELYSFTEAVEHIQDSRRQGISHHIEVEIVVEEP